MVRYSGFVPEIQILISLSRTLEFTLLTRPPNGPDAQTTVLETLRAASRVRILSLLPLQKVFLQLYLLSFCLILFVVAVLFFFFFARKAGLLLEN